MVKDKNMMKTFLLTTAMLAISTLPSIAQDGGVPTLTVTNKPIADVLRGTTTVTAQEKAEVVTADEVIPAAPMRADLKTTLYKQPTRMDDISAERVMNDYYAPINTMASSKITEVQNEMYDLQSKVANASDQLNTLEIVGQDLAANYYAAVATINTQLQSGTTPGNPRLKGRLTLAEDALDTLSGNVADLNAIAVEIADLASVTNFLQQQARSAYSLSGSVEEDHVALAQLEDEISNTSVAIERLLNNVNDNITRAAAYMTTERANLRTLALAITNGDLYGKSLSSRPFSLAGSTDIMERANYAPMTNGSQPMSNMNSQNVMSPIGQSMVNGGRSPMALSPAQPRPLMKIRFDRPDVDYSQALYMSVNDALTQYPNSQFELVAVSPGMGNPAKLAIESTKARRNAEKVLRNMVQMGIDSNQVNLANLTQDELQYNEVHLYLR